jgi:WD40 repeat protein
VSNEGWLLTAGGDGLIHVWAQDLTSHQWHVKRILAGHTQQVLTLTFLPDGTWASGSNDRRYQHILLC